MLGEQAFGSQRRAEVRILGVTRHSNRGIQRVCTQTADRVDGSGRHTEEVGKKSEAAAGTVAGICRECCGSTPVYSPLR
jgi:hypothetical protein